MEDVKFDDLLANPRESLGVEIKQWLDPTRDEGKAKIAKACMALRNNDGGILAIGIKNDGSVDTANAPPDVRSAFHQDVIQEIVSKYASEAFEVQVSFPVKDEQELAVVVIRPGVRTPIACKADLPGNGSLLKTDSVYVRTLSANNRVSSSAARWKDWEPLVQRCLENREADIGAFVRRHLSSLDFGLLLDGLRNEATRRPNLTGVERAVALLDDGYARFEAAVSKRNQRLDVRLGTREAAIVIDGDVARAELSEESLFRLDATVPRHTGWHPWVVLGGPEDCPYVLDDGWEAFIASDDSAFGKHLDFWRIEAAGRLYHLRGIEDDMPFGQGAPEPYTSLDFYLEISRTAEILSDAMAIAQAFNAQPDQSSLCVAMRLRNLQGRCLTSWVVPSRVFHSRAQSRQNEIKVVTQVPLDTPRNALAPHVERLVAPVFALFGGSKLEPSVIAGIVNETVGRRM